MLVVDEQSQVTRKPLRDTKGNSIRPGRYMMQRPGVKGSQLIRVGEDQLCFDLWFLVEIDGESVRQRIEELAGDVILTRLG